MKLFDPTSDTRASLLRARALFEEGLALVDAALGEEPGTAASAPEPELVSPKEAARRIGCSDCTVKRWCREFGVGEKLRTGRWVVDFVSLQALRRRQGKQSS
jgi:transposase-like protein